MVRLCRQSNCSACRVDLACAAGMDPITHAEVDNKANAVHAASAKPAGLPQARAKAEVKPADGKVGWCA